MLKTGLILLALVAVAAAIDVAVASDRRPQRTRKPRKGAKLVPVTTYQGHWLPKKSIIIVPKGDPRAYPPGRAPSSSSFRPTLQSGASPCASQGGQCVVFTTCKTGRVQSGLCPGTPNNVRCCLPAAKPSTPTKPTTPTTPTTPSTPTGSCGKYDGVATFPKTGNRNVVYQVVPIAQSDLTDPSKFGLADSQADNTIVKNLACKFEAMRTAAAAAGVKLTISSGFRTLARQQYFYNCYRNCNCNNCNLAAVPGNSNHGTGIALDLNTDCGGQRKGSKAPAACKSSQVYMWLYNNAQKFGFIRAVEIEPWHWEYHPGAAIPWFQKF